MILSLCFAASLCLMHSMTHAHNVLGGVYAIGNDIEGEIGFSNGDMAPPGVQVIVSDASGNEIVSVHTDDAGYFSFVAKDRIDHYFFADLSAGHVFNYRLGAEELPDALGEVNDDRMKNVTAIHAGAIHTEAARVFSKEQLGEKKLQTLIEKAVAKQVIPLRRELNAYKERASLRDIIGGIGYIFGLCGFGIWLSQRKRPYKHEAQEHVQ